MPRSMTGFGQASMADKDLSADVVVRTVNGRHLKTKVRLGLNMPAVSERVAALVADHITRGTVDVFIRLDWAGAGGAAFNDRVIRSYVKQLTRLAGELGVDTAVKLDRIALLPGAMDVDGSSNRAADQLWRKLRPAVREALERTVKMRASEGAHLAADLRKCCTNIRSLLQTIRRRAPKGAEACRERLSRRVENAMKKAGLEIDSAALAREVVMQSERSDISEELCRMDAHVKHFTSALREDGTGRKLEFIGQEMHREANTMASKASDPEMTETIIDLRGEVDRIREQVANLE